ncbi:mechanosensitive ion channel domain-containing protein [Methylomarinum vadi]|uniref:mechanosensitive ion channel domain-containing protein n=1 Tax=Methylomarinum vadi TaxID=438855 RepID=UPI0004DF05C0|nr:mechanosensitive ion channel domain-containing protein [Methylomarinum vadi]
MKTKGRSLVLLLLCLFLLLTGTAWAEKHTTTTDTMLKAVREKIAITRDKTNIDEALRLRILNAYYAAEDNLEELATFEQKSQEAQKQLKSLPAEIKQLSKRVEEKEKQLKNQKLENFSLYPTDELEQRLIIEKSNLNELKSKINDLEIQLTDQMKLPQQIREQTAAIKSAQANLNEEQASLASLVQNKQELDARQAQLDSRSRKLNADLAWLDLENIVYPLKVEAQKQQLQLLNLQADQLSALIKAIDDFLIERRQQEIDQAQADLIQAEKEASDKDPVIQAATRQNIRYNQLLQETNQKLEYYLDKKNSIDNRYKQLEKDYQSAEQKINLAGLSPALGNLLREQRRNLPLGKNYQDLSSTIQEEMAHAGLELFQLGEAQKSLADMDQALADRMAKSVPPDLDQSEKLKIRTELRLLLNNQKELVTKLRSLFSGYSRTLADVDFALHQLISLGEKYGHYLDERLLWVPSAPVIDKHYIKEIYHSLLWFGDIAHWRQLAIDIDHSVQASPFQAGLGIFIIFLQFWFRRLIKANMQELLKKSGKLYSDRFVYTFDGLALAFLLALPFALLLAWLGWLLSSNAQAANFSQSVADGLLAASLPMLILQFFYQLFKPKGVVQSLFNWQERTIALLYGQIKWIRSVVIPAVFLIGMFVDEAYSEHSYTLGRMALIVTMLVLTYVLFRFSHPSQGLARDFYQEKAGSWLSRLRYLWCAAITLMPVVISGFAIAGYYQSALELQHKLVILLRLVFFSVILHEIVIRWLMLANRQMALKNARQKRKQQEQALAKEKEGAPAAIIIPEEEILLDIPKINEQNRKLLSATIIAILVVGSWLTLSDILPAFSIFERVVLWQHTVAVDGQESLQPITLVNVFVCLLYLVLMLVFVNNFSGLVDLIFAGKYSMTAGSRYALVQLTRYTVITIALIAVANELGGSWSQVQWLVAALGVGLGFGLQEIFANLVSGIILLFERPIRVGDTVTVGDVSGKVSHIEMRATTIIDWDMKELVVPNKTFITEKLINWTLTDTVTRVVIPVGIGYGCDEELALRIFKQIFEESPLVLKEPEPQVFFIGFGESSLDFSLRIFVRDLADRLPVTDDIHRRVRRAFKEHNVEIPFPQRDLHIRSSDVPLGQA